MQGEIQPVFVPDSIHPEAGPLGPRSIHGAAVLDGSFILTTSAIRLITVGPASLLGLT